VLLVWSGLLAFVVYFVIYLSMVFSVAFCS
jgi:hypothetical protein